MTAEGSGQLRRVPSRQCVACRKLVPRLGLFRFVRQPDGEVAFDEAQRLNGRGAYVCRNAGCVQVATRRGALQRALRRGVNDELLAHLTALAATSTHPPAERATNSPPEDGLTQPNR